MSHRKDTLRKIVNDPDFRIKDAQAALDMSSRTGAINAMKNEAIEVLREIGWGADKS